MNKFCAFFLLSATALLLACGTSSHRQLQSIMINATPNGGLTEYTATGTFSAPPTTVTPLPVSWYTGTVGTQYTLTTQPFQALTSCASPAVALLFVIAPVDPNAPSSGKVSDTKMVMVTGPGVCL